MHSLQKGKILMQKNKKKKKKKKKLEGGPGCNTKLHPRGARDVMVIVAGNGHGDMSSNLGRD